VGDAIAYIDAMNLYHGIRAKYGRRYLWLDLYALVARLRQPDTLGSNGRSDRQLF
jgi:hypothetical protein